jgi:hypothetical protein
MTVPYHSKRMYVPSYQYAYQQHFEVALLNLEEVIREERMQKRIRKHKEKPQQNK